MSIFLVLFLLLLTAGAAITALLAYRRHKYSSLIGAAIVLATLILWVIVKAQLPLESVSKSEPGVLTAPLWHFYIGELSWGLSLITLLLAAGIFVAIDVCSRATGPIKGNYRLRWQVLPLIFLMVGATNLALWSNSLITLIQSWTLFIISWSFVFGAIGSNAGQWRIILFRSCFLATSLIFLWMANASNEGATSTVAAIPDWTSEASYWALLAASVFLGLILLHWWRPFESTLPPPVDSLMHLLPVVCGGWLFIQVGSGAGIDAGVRIIITLLCLLGLLTGATMAWINIKEPRRRLPYLVLSYVNIIALSTVWVGAEAAAAEMQVLLLALGGLFLFSSWSEWSGRWERIISYIFVAALAGLPLTNSFPGRVTLYKNWLQEGQVILAIMVAFIFATILGAALLIVSHRATEKIGADQRKVDNLEYGAVLAIFAIGVIGVNDLDQLQINILPLAFIILSALGGYLLSRYSIRAYELEQTAVRALHVNFPIQQVTKYVAAVLSNVKLIVREGAAILEGEGGMVWLLVIVVILWLARIS